MQQEFASRVLPLEGAVQHYAWGGARFIPDLLGTPNPERRPFAELWLGAHPSAPAVARIDGEGVPLDALVAADPQGILGPDVAARFGGRLPYLMKVLDAAQMLSLQAHPNLRQAREGWARENARGLGADDPRRSYRDDNHKPEVHVALTDFWMLHGFREPDDLVRVLAGVPELAGLGASLGRPPGADPVRALYHALMHMPQARVDAMLRPMVERLDQRQPADRSTPEFWALRAAHTYPMADGHIDRGVAALFLLNLVRLAPGQGTYQPAGVLHAYLEGANVELMANSDNVLRGGLTPKHIDVDELLRVMAFRCEAPEVLTGHAAPGGWVEFRTPSEEFELSVLRLDAGGEGAVSANHGPHTLLVTRGRVAVEWADGALALAAGGAALAPHGVAYAIRAQDAAAQVFRAAVPADGR